MPISFWVKGVPRSLAAQKSRRIPSSFKKPRALCSGHLLSRLAYEHVAMIVAFTGANTSDADVKIACHTKNRFNITYLDVPFPWVTLLRLPN